MNRKYVIKKLSKNDLGITGSHQSGFVVPKLIARMEFFPVLNSLEYNPRKIISVICNGKSWQFSYIYYNNKLHGKGTRDEYRITGLAAFFRDNNCKEGDSLKIQSTEVDDCFEIEVIRVTNIEDVISKDLTIRADWAW